MKKLPFGKGHYKKYWAITGIVISILLLSVFSCIPNNPTVTYTVTTTSTLTTTQEETSSPSVMENGVFNDSQWRLIYLNRAAIIQGSKITLNFHNGSLEGFSGINTYGVGKYLVNAENMTISFPTLTSTQMGSPSNALTEQEKAHYNALSKTVRFNINGTRLVFYDQSNQTILVFEE